MPGDLQAAGPGAKAVNGADQMTLQLVDGKFRDSRWQEGRWVLDSFKDNSGSMDWDKVQVKINGQHNYSVHMFRVQ